MSVVLLILKIFGWILLGALGVITIAMFIPVTVKLKYELGGFSAQIKILFFKFLVYNSETEPKQKEIEQDVTEDKNKKQKKIGAKSKLDFNLIKALIKPVTGAVGYLIGQIRFENVFIRFVASGLDAASVGIKTGRYWELVSGILTICRSVWKRMSFDEIAVIPDFANKHKGEEKFGCQIVAIPFIIIVAAVIFLKRFISYKLHQKKQQRKSEKEILKNECKST